MITVVNLNQKIPGSFLENCLHFSNHLPYLFFLLALQPIVGLYFAAL